MPSFVLVLQIYLIIGKQNVTRSDPQ